MKVFKFTPLLSACCFALCLALSISTDVTAQVFTSAETSSPKSRDSLQFFLIPQMQKADYQLDLWANSTSNVVTAGFMNTIARGGFISQESLDPILSAHNGQKGYLGGSAGWEVSWSGRPVRDKAWAMCGSFGSEVIVDTRWTSELFELVWYGNASSTGRVNMLSGSGARLGAFNRFSLGAENTKTKQRIEISLVQRLAGIEWSLPYGYLWVSEDADSLEAYIQTEARIHAGADSKLLPAYGVGISGNVPLRFDGFPLELDISFKDIGLLFEPEGSRVYWIQDGITTTGLPVLGDSLTWESIIEGNVSTDSLIQTGESVSRMVLLPSKLAVNISYKYSEKIAINAGISAGGWMPQSLMSIGLELKRDENVSWGIDLRNGGWGDDRFGVWAKVKITKGRSLFLYLEDPVGLFFQSESAANTTCRGISFRLTKENG